MVFKKGDKIRCATKRLFCIKVNFFQRQLIFFPRSYFNHSCFPNAVLSRKNHGVQTKRNIKNGDQLFFSYIDSNLPLKEREMILSGQYGFECKCGKCEFEKNGFDGIKTIVFRKQISCNNFVNLRKSENKKFP